MERKWVKYLCDSLCLDNLFFQSFDVPRQYFQVWFITVRERKREDQVQVLAHMFVTSQVNYPWLKENPVTVWIRGTSLVLRSLWASHCLYLLSKLKLSKASGGAIIKVFLFTRVIAWRNIVTKQVMFALSGELWSSQIRARPVAWSWISLLSVSSWKYAHMGCVCVCQEIKKYIGAGWVPGLCLHDSWP